MYCGCYVPLVMCLQLPETTNQLPLKAPEHLPEFQISTDFIRRNRNLSGVQAAQACILLCFKKS